ncbi:hypothetical protein ACH4Q6_32020 [Streptomyces lydicus]|uniref:hypothetical protein n=1 Tax=Streptomyces lydicus TaxID=47763 RepID=UPI0037931B8E
MRGYEATLFHLAAVRRGGRYGTDVHFYSVAVLALPRSFPDTVASVGTLVYGLRMDPLPPRAGAAVHVPTGRKPRMIACSVDPAFAELIFTERVLRMTADAKMGWRLHGDRMIGWIKERKPYERVIDLAEAMADVVAELPASVPARDPDDQEGCGR